MEYINMYCGYQFKSLANVTLSLILFGFSHTLFALGLSDIEVYSQLGEPLKAKVTILGAAELKSQACIKLGPDSALQQVNFMMGPINGDTAKLTLTSNNIVNEPIVNLSIIAGCDSSIERHYVLLLDPPISFGNLQPNNSAIETLSAESPMDDSANNAISPSTKPAIEKPRTSPKKAAKKKKTKRQSAPAKRDKEQATNQKSINSPLAAETSSSTIAESSLSSEPRLSISGGSDNVALNDTGLRLDKQLNLTPNAYGPYVPPTAEDVLLADEMTVVNNRISHLQNQIDQLQKKNLKLSSDNTLKTTELAQTKSKQNTLVNLLLFIGAILLLVLTYFIFAWLRRRQIEKQADYAEALWLSANAEASTEEDVELASIKEKSHLIDDETEVTEEDSDDMLPPAPIASVFKSVDDEEQQPIVIEDDQTFSVLDHADVFLFHGRANLAIQLLQNYLIEHPKRSVTIWLFLLDLLAKENLPDLYEQTATDCKLYYNIKIPAFSEQETDAIESLEDFPRLTQGLMQVWNTPSALIYLDDLIYNNRLTPRVGLPKNLIEELTLLKAITQESVNPADAPPLDSKKLAEIKEKEALLEKIKIEKLETMAEAEKLAIEKVEAEKKEAGFEFTLADK
jgi:hypothetical protein